MELELLNQLTGAGANTVTIIVGWVLMRHELRLMKLESKQEKGAN